MIYLYIIMIIYKNITNKTQMILYITIPKEKTMKFLQTNKMKIKGLIRKAGGGK